MRMGPTTSRRACVGAAAVALVVGVVAGCSGGGAKPGPAATTASSTPTPSPSPTASPTPDTSVKPVRPAAMDQVSAAGAEAVAVYFLNLYPYVYATNDLTEWKALSHPECVFCKSVIDNVEKQVAARTRTEGGLVTTERIDTVPISSVLFSVRMVASQQAAVVRGNDGSTVKETGNSRFGLDVAVLSTGSGWIVRGIEVQDAPAS